MKYLYAIICHMFPRKRWTLVKTIHINDTDGDKIGERYVLQDQFGNLKFRKYTV